MEWKTSSKWSGKFIEKMFFMLKAFFFFYSFSPTIIISREKNSSYESVESAMNIDLKWK